MPHGAAAVHSLLAMLPRLLCSQANYKGKGKCTSTNRLRDNTNNSRTKSASLLAGIDTDDHRVSHRSIFAGYKGKIARANANGTFDVAYDDGDSERRVSKRNVRALGGVKKKAKKKKVSCL